MSGVGTYETKHRLQEAGLVTAMESKAGLAFSPTIGSWVCKTVPVRAMLNRQRSNARLTNAQAENCVAAYTLLAA